MRLNLFERMRKRYFRRSWLKRKAADVDDEYKSKLRAAKGFRSGDEHERLRSEYQFARSEWTDELEEIETKRLLKRARNHLLSEADLPQQYPAYSNWEDSPWGHRYLRQHAFVALERLVRQAERAASMHRIQVATFWFGVISGLVGLGLSVFNVVFASQ